MPGRVILVDKPVGPTPLQAVRALQASDATLAGLRMGYAGRLDPMAEGLLLVLAGDETKRVAAYRGLDKVYDVDVLFGAATDSYDTLGLLTAPVCDAARVDESAVLAALPAFRGEIVQPYPPFSAARVAGRPLFYWAREGTLPDAPGPAEPRTVHSLELTGWRAIAADALLALVVHRTAIVRGEFRQSAIAAAWRAALATAAVPRFPVAQVRVACSSGTYMRGIAHALGARVGTGALALRIRRTHVGSYALADARPLPP